MAEDRSKPFYDLEPKLRPHRSYIYLTIEVVALAAILFNYNNLVHVYKHLGPACLGAATAALAQSFNQFIKYKHLDSNLAKFVVWGIINGLYTALWLDMLLVQVEKPMVRILADQTIGAPLFQLTFTILSTMWEGEDVLIASIRTSYLHSLRYSYCFWPLVLVVMFTVIPSRNMVTYNCAANFMWNLILSRLS